MKYHSILQQEPWRWTFWCWHD